MRTKFRKAKNSANLQCEYTKWSIGIGCRSYFANPIIEFNHLVMYVILDNPIFILILSKNAKKIHDINVKKKVIMRSS